ncbi:MAG: hypothetical protein R3301_16950 [Saprospiraceae bacterium]|nr:hypothetical protein [Saprospiraceae bacterium]
MKQLDLQTVFANPVYQAIAVLGVSLVFVLVDKLGGVTGIWETEPRSTWIIMTAFVLFFALFNSVLSLRTKNMNKYWSRSIMCFVGLIAVSVLASTILSGVSMDEAGTFRWLFVVLTIGYLVFLVIVRLMKRIVDIAIRQDEKLRGK